MEHFLKLALEWLLSALGVGFLIWLSYRALKRSDDPGELLFKGGLSVVMVGGSAFWISRMMRDGGGSSAFIVVGLIVSVGIVLSIMWTPHISAVLISPLTDLFDGGKEAPDPKPYYSIVLARRKLGKPREAVVLLREQLAKFPNDYEGIMLLASIQAEDLSDLQGSALTLQRFCNSPGIPDRQIEAALRQLADWHLKIAVDVDAARATLQEIITRFPGSEMALRAEQRLAHFNETGRILLDAHDRQAMNVPEGVNNIGLLDSTAFLIPKDIEPGKLAAAHIKHLESHPHDAEVREKLATIYAHDFKRLDLAAMELEQLIAEPRHKPKQIARWLNLLANWQVELGATVAEVTATLSRIVEQFPNSPDAEVARRRLELVRLEIEGKKETPSKRLGVYEQNIGLKGKLPGRDKL
jgi:tetratricopeptide (TPR) repeat protein